MNTSKNKKKNIFASNPKKRKKSQNKMTNIEKILFGLTFLCIFVCLTGFVLAKPDKDIIQYKLPFLNTLLSKKLTHDSLEGGNFNLPMFSKRQNILLLGVDKNPYSENPFEGSRSDTIILLNIDPKDKSIKALSIPRDSKVYIDGQRGTDKINAAHAYGGINLAKRTIEKTLGVRINRYIMVNTDAVVKMVDLIGGVPVYVEKDMHYRDSTDGLMINLKKGEHILNGKQAEGYLRYRKDALGDIGRTARQQWFLRSFFKKLQSPSTIAKIPEILNIANDYIKTDMSLYEISNLASMLKGFDLDDVEVATLPGAPSKRGIVSYWILDPVLTQQTVDRMIYRKTANEETLNYKAGIIYSLPQANRANIIKEKLESMGYRVNLSVYRSLPHSQIISHSPSIGNEFINKIKVEVPEIKSTQVVYDPTKLYCVNSDFTIILSDI